MAAGGRTALWWDMESCPLTSSVEPYIVTAMASALLRQFNIINVNAGGGGHNPHDHFSAYEFVSQTETELDQMLINSGIRLQQSPPGKAGEIEKMMMADVLLWAMDTPPPANIVFIVGNLDLSYLFEKLRQRSYNVFLVSSSRIQVPQGMLNAAKDWLGWYSFIRSLENKIQEFRFPSGHGFSGVHDRTFSNAAIPNSSTSIHNRELEESYNISTFSNAAIPNSSTSIHNRELEESYNISTFSNAAIPNSSTSIHNRELEESYNISGFNYGLGNSFSLPYLSGGWNSTNSVPSNETGRSSVQPDPGFHGHFFSTEQPKRPPLLPSPTEKPDRPTFLPSTAKKKNPGKILSPSMKNVPKKKSGSLKEFKAWLGRVVNSEEYAENGYNISGIRKDFERATGKILDEQPLGFLKIIDLVNECKDVAVLKEVKKCCHVAFPVVKPNKQSSPGPSTLWANPNSKPKTERDPRLKLKASADDFRKYIHQMVFSGQFSQGFLMSTLRQIFEERTGKFLDVQHLGYQKLSELVASYSHLVSMNSSGPGPVRLFPAGFVPNNPNCITTIKESSIGSSMNVPYGGSKALKEKAEVYSISSVGSGKGLAENITLKENIFDELFYIQSVDSPLAMVDPEIELLPSMPETSTKAKAESPFQEHGIKADSSNTSGGSQVSEWEEGHSSASSYRDSDQVEEHLFYMHSVDSLLELESDAILYD